MGSDCHGLGLQAGGVSTLSQGCEDMIDQVRTKIGEARQSRLGSAAGAIAMSAGRQRTPEQILGPFFPAGRMPSESSDLSIVRSGLGRAKGEIIQVAGRVLNRDGKPVRGA